MIQDLHLPIIRSTVVGSHIPVNRYAPLAGRHLPEQWTPRMMPRQPASWVIPDIYKSTIADGALLGDITDSVGYRYSSGGANILMRHNAWNGFAGISHGEVAVSQGLSGITNIPLGRFACFAVFNRTVGDNAPSNYSDFYMAHSATPATTAGNYIWGRGGGLSQVNTNPSLAKTYFQTTVTQPAIQGLYYTISGGSRPGNVAWGKINGFQPAGFVGGNLESSLHNNVVTTGGDLRLFIFKDDQTAALRSRGILLEFLYFNYAVNASDEEKIHDYLRRKYKHY